MSLSEADITAHVDFVSLAEAVTKQGLKAPNIITQRDFLIAMGVQTRRDMLVKNSIDRKSADEIITSVDRLIDPNQMGTLFKVLVI